MPEQLQPFPNQGDLFTNQEIAFGNLGTIRLPWYYLLQTLWRRTGGSGAILPTEDADASVPYRATVAGTLIVSGGTVTAISLTRSPDTVDLGITAGPIPVQPGDVVTITQSDPPTVTFLPTGVLGGPA